MSDPAIAAVITGGVLVLGVVFVVLAVRECTREITDVIAAIPDDPDALDRCEHAIAREHAADEHMDRLLFSRRPPIDERDAELWAKQMLDPGSDDLIRLEAER
jgi:hypothetical protein